MNANEFVRENGLYAFKHALAQLSFKPKMFLIVYQYECEFVHEIKPNHGNCVFGYDDVKRLVESHELVEKNQGLNGARNVLKLLEASLDIGLYHGIDGVDATTEVPKLRQAIADVESCMEVFNESN